LIQDHAQGILIGPALFSCTRIVNFSQLDKTLISNYICCCVQFAKADLDAPTTSNLIFCFHQLMLLHGQLLSELTRNDAAFIAELLVKLERSQWENPLSGDELGIFVKFFLDNKCLNETNLQNFVNICSMAGNFDKNLIVSLHSLLKVIPDGIAEHQKLSHFLNKLPNRYLK